MIVNFKQHGNQQVCSFEKHMRATVFVVSCLFCVMGICALPVNSSALTKEASTVSHQIPTTTAEDLQPPAAESLFPLAPLCFGGSATYQYFDERLAVQIQARYSENLAYFVCDIQLADPTALHTALSQDKLKGRFEKTSTMASRHSAVLAINGDGYYMHSEGIIIRDGVLLRARNSGRHLLAVDSQGDLTVIASRKGEKPKMLSKELLSSGVTQTWEFGPELVRGGEAVPMPTKFKLIAVRDSQKEPRTAIGQIGPLHYVVIVVDGRKKGYSNGISLADLQQLFLDAGAETAFNLDGGGSTTLYFCGEVINRPSSGGERLVSDIIYFQ